MEIKPDVVEKHKAAIAQQAWRCKRLGPHDPAVDFEDLMHDGVCFVLEKVVPSWDERKGVLFLTFMVAALKQYYARRNYKLIYRGKLAARASMEEQARARCHDGTAIAIWREVIAALSDGAREVVHAVMEPSEELITRVARAGERGRTAQNEAVADYCEEMLGIEWSAIRKEVREAIRNTS